MSVGSMQSRSHCSCDLWAVCRNLGGQNVKNAGQVWPLAERSQLSIMSKKRKARQGSSICRAGKSLVSVPDYACYVFGNKNDSWFLFFFLV